MKDRNVHDPAAHSGGRDLNLRPSMYGDQIVDPDPEAEHWGGGDLDAGYRTFAQHPEVEDPYGHYGSRGAGASHARR